MIGRIESYDPETQVGKIASNGRSYSFDVDAWLPDVPPEIDDDVNFEVEDGLTVNVDLVGAYLAALKPVKYKYLAGVLGLLLGFAGVHRFYLGYYRIGLAQLALTLLTLGYGALWGFVETALIFAGHINKDAKGRPLK